MDEHPTIINFRRKLCSIYGYDENLKYVGRHKATRVQEEPNEFQKPRDFLQFAIDEVKTLEQPKSRTNCLTNCKRAIDAQMDRLIWHLGYFPLARREKWSIPRKLKFISKSGFLAPNIIERVNRLRNLLEHEFVLPSKQDVEDALDVAMLFVSYGELVRVPTLNICVSGQETVRYDYDEMVFNFFDTNPRTDTEVKPTVSIPYGDPRFDDFYNFLVKTVPSMKLGGDVQA